MENDFKYIGLTKKLFISFSIYHISALLKSDLEAGVQSIFGLSSGYTTTPHVWAFIVQMGISSTISSTAQS